MEEHSLRMFQNAVLRRIFGPEGTSQEDGENCLMRSLIVCK
jgi:hypothetical protein